MEIDIFSKKYNSILHPFHLESLNHLSGFIKSTDNSLSFIEMKKNTLEVLNFLLENNIVYVLEKDFMMNKEFRKIKLSNEEIINEINNNWFEDISWEDFYFMLWFRFQDWYKDRLIAEGLVNKPMKWNDFVKNNIGDLEQWIEENRPK